MGRGAGHRSLGEGVITYRHAAWFSSFNNTMKVRLWVSDSGWARSPPPEPRVPKRTSSQPTALSKWILPEVKRTLNTYRRGSAAVPRHCLEAQAGDGGFQLTSPCSNSERSMTRYRRSMAS